MKRKALVILGVILATIIAAVVLWYVFKNKDLTSNTIENNTSSASIDTTETNIVNTAPTDAKAVTEEQKYKIFSAQTLEGAPSQFSFSAEVPKTWDAEVVSGISSINLFDSADPGTNNLEKSQIFIRYFEANQFLTLTTVNILDRTETTVAKQPAVRYTIEKKASAAKFSNQPEWRNTKHTVTDVRVSDSSPSVFYVIAKNPELDDEVYKNFLNTLSL